MNSDSYVLLGAGGHTRSLIPLLRTCGCQVAGIYDDSFTKDVQEVIQGVAVKGTFATIPEDTCCISSSGLPNGRSSVWHQFFRVRPERNFIHPKAFVDKSATMGAANQVFAFTFVNADVRIGDNNLLNTACILEHEVRLGSHNHISVRATICGRVVVGDRCYIGAGVVIRDKVEIHDDVVVGAGAVVVRSLIEPGTYVGVPARRIKSE